MKAQVFNPLAGWVPKTTSLHSLAFQGEPVLRLNSFVRTFLSSCLDERRGYTCYVMWWARKNHKWNKPICASPTRCVHFTSLTKHQETMELCFQQQKSTQGLWMTCPGPQGHPGRSLGSVSELMYWVADLTLWSCPFLCFSWGPLVHSLSGLCLLSLPFSYWLIPSKNCSIQLSLSLKINPLK